MANVKQIETNTLALKSSSVFEYCQAMQKIKYTGFWWYLDTNTLFGNYSVPFKIKDESWWYQVKPGLCWSVNVLSSCSEIPRLPVQKSFLGFQCLCKNSISNSKQIINTILNIAQYDESSINSKRRNSIRKGVSLCTLKVLSDINESIIEECTEVWNNFVQRTGWKKRIETEYLKKTWSELLELPGTTIILGREKTSGRIGGFLITKLIGDTAYVDTIASHSAFLKINVNDILMFSFIKSSQQIPHIKKVHYAIKSFDEKLEKFKTSIGFSHEIYPSYTYLRPGIKFILKIARKKNYNRLIGNY